MTYTELLSNIFKKTKKFILSSEYKEEYCKKNTFVRKRKLSFSNTIFFICSALRKSLATELTDFAEDNPNLKFPDITKQAFSKARQFISENAFKKLCTLCTTEFYKSDVPLHKWNNYLVLAIDGTMLQIPDTSENTDYFEFSSNQFPTKTALASAYDVLNDMIVDETISTYPANERKLAKSHIESFQKLGVTHKTIFTLDRGYHSYDMFEWFHHKKLFFVMRLSSSFRSFDSLKTDFIISYSIKEDTKKIRLLKVVLPDDTIERLLTNIY